MKRGGSVKGGMTTKAKKGLSLFERRQAKNMGDNSCKSSSTSNNLANNSFSDRYNDLSLKMPGRGKNLSLSLQSSVGSINSVADPFEDLARGIYDLNIPMIRRVSMHHDGTDELME